MKGLHATFYFSEKGIHKTTLKIRPEDDSSCFLTWDTINYNTDKNPIESSLNVSISEWVDQYNLGINPTICLPLYWEEISNFTHIVLKKLQGIPFGVSTSYSKLAHLVNNINAARAVGTACGRNPFLLIVPCHRVLTSIGNLGGFSAGLEIKKELLAFEGVRWNGQKWT